MASSHQTGPILQHWNDPPLDFAYSASSSRSATPAGAGTPSHTSLSTKYTNNSTLSLAVNVGSRATSRPSSASGIRPGGGDTAARAAALMTAAYVAEQEGQAPYDETLAGPSLTPPDNEDDDMPNVDAMQVDTPGVGPAFEDLLAALFALPTTMPAPELAQVQARLRKYLPGITDGQKEELGWVLREVVEGRQEGASWGREMVVRFMKEWVGRGDVSLWGGGLRRVVESLRVGGEGKGV